MSNNPVHNEDTLFTILFLLLLIYLAATFGVELVREFRGA